MKTYFFIKCSCVFFFFERDNFLWNNFTFICEFVYQKKVLPVFFKTKNIGHINGCLPLFIGKLGW